MMAWEGCYKGVNSCLSHFTMFACIAFVLSALAVAVSAQTPFAIVNNCGYQVDPAFFPAATASDGSLTGGFPLAAGASADVTLGATWSGRIWGRTGCDADGNCQTGGCGAESCTGPAGAGPTLAQFTLDGWSNLDFFNPSTADGFNLALTIVPGPQCSTAAQSCTAEGQGNGCGSTSSCPTGTNYTIQFC
ncbi:Osmotin thaumatin-like protein [Fomitopsis schrenkii]|uniref:Osmotin thaumatin-like protein n=1 Tax=Fomitopsis schrenkii TaxID=2126942 RepID=S8FD37_FOMSC|nr:Osmotin thaumatin-like protein [Fomitopsis schrenkii]